VESSTLLHTRYGLVRHGTIGDRHVVGTPQGAYRVPANLEKGSPAAVVRWVENAVEARGIKTPLYDSALKIDLGDSKKPATHPGERFLTWLVNLVPGLGPPVNNLSPPNPQLRQIYAVQREQLQQAGVELQGDQLTVPNTTLGGQVFAHMQFAESALLTGANASRQGEIAPPDNATPEFSAAYEESKREIALGNILAVGEMIAVGIFGLSAQRRLSQPGGRTPAGGPQEVPSGSAQPRLSSPSQPPQSARAQPTNLAERIRAEGKFGPAHGGFFGTYETGKGAALVRIEARQNIQREIIVAVTDLKSGNTPNAGRLILREGLERSGYLNRSTRKVAFTAINEARTQQAFDQGRTAENSPFGRLGKGVLEQLGYEVTRVRYIGLTSSNVVVDVKAGDPRPSNLSILFEVRKK
jgi:hypothetical protein